MTSRHYRPRRAGKRWLEGAPDYVLDCFDNKGQTADRYTVLFGGTFLDEWCLQNRQNHCLDMSEAPSSAQGVSMWGYTPTHWRPSHRRVRWLDLPEHIRNHVIMRAEND